MTAEIRTTFTIELAGHRIDISTVHEETRELCREYILRLPAGCGTEEFADRAADESVSNIAPDGFKIFTDQRHIDFEREKSLKEDELEGIPYRNFSDPYLETLAVYRQIAEKMIDHDTILFHGSALAIEDKAVIFTGPSGIGKSTHARLWTGNIPGVVMINDDKPLITFRKQSEAESKAFVFGTPWDGKHRRSTNTSAKIEAICFLRQAKENIITEIDWKEAYPMILRQTYRPGESGKLLRTLQLVEEFRKSGIRLYSLECNMDKEAAIMAHREIFR